MTTKTDQEVGEWLAENIFDGHKGAIANVEGWFIKMPLGRATEKEFFTEYNWIQHVYCPEGLSDVWDAIWEKDRNLEINFILTAKGTPCCEIGYFEEVKGSGHGKTRSEAFYNAIFEVMG